MYIAHFQLISSSSVFERKKNTFEKKKPGSCRIMIFDFIMETVSIEFSLIQQT